jgi:hypothetical protein
MLMKIIGLLRRQGPVSTITNTLVMYTASSATGKIIYGAIQRYAETH